MFYHDALSLMTAKDTIQWMKDEDIYKRWLLPVNGLNAGTIFERRPVGNSPEFMPMDNSLHKDVDDGVRRHIAYTLKLKADDKKKFSLSTPERGSSAYHRVWNKDGYVDCGVPSSKRIIQDTGKFLRSLHQR